MPKYLKPEAIHFIGSRMGQDRCLWGTNGLPWKESLKQTNEVGLRDEARRKPLWENAARLFQLSSGE
jgi:predicted TIM-barrel fold metal-dependent hydrolase